MPRGGYTQTRTFAYNGRLLTSATNPENGTVTYTYNNDWTVATRTERIPTVLRRVPRKKAETIMIFRSACYHQRRFRALRFFLRVPAFGLIGIVTLGSQPATQKANRPALQSEEVSFEETTAGRRDLEALSLSASGWYMENRSYVVDRLALLRTDDAGRTWRKLTPKDSARTGEIYGVTFLTLQRGWLHSATGIWQTDDAGAHWRRISSGGALPVFVDRLHGWMRVDQTGDLSTWLPYTSSDGGRTWTILCAPQSPPGPHEIQFSSLADAWALAVQELRPGYKYSIEHSGDGGCHWASLGAPGPAVDDNLNALYFADSRVGWLAGDGTLYYTYDGGHTWARLWFTAGIRILDLYFTTRNRGWFLAVDYGRPIGGLYKTKDGGRHWSRLSAAQVRNAVIPRAWNRGRLVQLIYSK